jgi:hypothetical protein
LTVTLKDCEVELPEASVAVQVTAVVPSGNVLPEPGVQLTLGDASTVSPAVGDGYVTAAPRELVALTVWSSGTDWSVGAVVSSTMTLKDADAELLELSVAVQVTGVVPNGNVPPELGVQATLGDGSTRSWARTENDAVAPDPFAASTI